MCKYIIGLVVKRLIQKNANKIKHYSTLEIK